MFWLVILFCAACGAQPTDLQSRSIDTSDDNVLDELDHLTRDILENTIKEDTENRNFGYKRSSVVQRSSATHYNPCALTIEEKNSATYLNLPKHVVVPTKIGIKKCTGTTWKKNYKRQSCMNIMDCVTQYRRVYFQKKPKGADCSKWVTFDKLIPVGCECMMQT